MGIFKWWFCILSAGLDVYWFVSIEFLLYLSLLGVCVVRLQITSFHCVNFFFWIYYLMCH